MTSTLWRIGTDTVTYEAHDLSGKGAAASGGRWNSRGVHVVYTASSVALAVLETVVHLDAPPFNRYLVRIDVPDEVLASAQRMDPTACVGWDALPKGMASISAGDAWLASGASALLYVPSVVVPEEYNILLNPAHLDMRDVRATKLRRFLYDPRLPMAPKPAPKSPARKTSRK